MMPVWSLCCHMPKQPKLRGKWTHSSRAWNVENTFTNLCIKLSNVNLLCCLYSFLGSTKIQQHNRYVFKKKNYFPSFISEFVFISNFTVFSFLKYSLVLFSHFYRSWALTEALHKPTLLSRLSREKTAQIPLRAQGAQALLIWRQKESGTFDLIYRSLVVRRMFRDLSWHPRSIHKLFAQKGQEKGFTHGVCLFKTYIQSMCRFSTEGATGTRVTTGRSTLEKSTSRRE